MTRVAKSDVNAALARAGKNILEAGGNDGVTSRKELQAAVKAMGKTTEAALTRQLFAFIDHRDHEGGARVTKADVQKALGYAKDHLVGNRDLNNNGLSRAEVSQLSNLGKLAVALAEEMKTGSVGGATLSTAKLGAAINAAMKDVNWSSEGDSTPEFVAVPFKASTAVNSANVIKALDAELKAIFAGSDDEDLGNYTATVEKLTSKDLKELATAEGDEESDIAFAKGFAEFKKLAEANLTGLVSVKVGPKDDDGSLASDVGTYARFFLGRTADGKLAGVQFTVVET